MTVEDFLDYFDLRTMGMSDAQKDEVLNRFLETMEEDQEDES